MCRIVLHRTGSAGPTISFFLRIGNVFRHYALPLSVRIWLFSAREGMMPGLPVVNLQVLMNLKFTMAL
jgi:hypothetical protein